MWSLQDIIVLYMKYGFGTKSICSEIVKVSETYLHCILQFKVSAVTLSVNFLTLERRRAVNGPCNCRFYFRRVYVSYLADCLQYFCAFNYIIYSKWCTAYFNRFYDLPASYIGLVFIFCILHLFNHIRNMLYVILQHEWVDVWMNNNNNVTTFYNICQSFSCRTFET